MAQYPQGIDFHEALAILSSRSSGKEEQKEEPSCPCHAPAAASGAQTFGNNMGQVIHLDESESKPESSKENADDKSAERKRQELVDSLRKMSTKHLIQAVLEAQQKRVSTYREYNRGLEAILATKNVSYYPTVCTEATAAFSVVSDTIKAIQNELQGRADGNEYMTLIQHLQKQEQAKLQYTAAYHLEQIRLNQSDPEDVATKRLLEESSGSLQSKLASCVNSINEALEEIQCAVVDAPNDDGQP